MFDPKLQAGDLDRSIVPRWIERLPGSSRKDQVIRLSPWSAAAVPPL
jgi:hypothetical protein